MWSLLSEETYNWFVEDALIVCSAAVLGLAIQYAGVFALNTVMPYVRSRLSAKAAAAKAE